MTVVIINLKAYYANILMNFKLKKAGMRMSEIRRIEDWEHMIDLLNKAETEVDRLKQENEQWHHLTNLYNESKSKLTRRITKSEEQLKREAELHGEKSVLIEQLREALRKCSFLTPKDDGYYCVFCDEKFTHLKYQHKDNCEYVSLIK